ncbi:ABC transporter ATP-binding protein [Calidifontibacter sp. DB0510]|uniref:ABC transporter ATP-binding protein n=2 Tax=Metallococcus carri TaxID=1656884 RepID=A0A967AZU7_9MICO|nr:ABC transporter ATP-binding protein [Metallococcus carri]NOP37153.1 ABC transporter ATP-binding protein [Calidifontibacter sp. DB2511S]
MFAVALASLGATIAIPLFTKKVIDGPVAHQDVRGLWVLGLAALGLGVLEAALWMARRWLVQLASTGVENDLRKDLYARLQVLPMSFHGAWQSGQLLSRIMNDLSAMRRFIGFAAVLLILNLIQVIVVTGILLAMYWPLGIVVLISIVPVAAANLHYERQFTKASRAAQDQTGNVATTVEESALGLRVVKSFGREDYVYDRFDAQAVKLRDIQLRKVTIMSRFWTLLEVIPTAALVIVLAFGARAVALDQITLGTLVAFITFMLNLVWPIASLGFLLSMLQETMTASTRVVEIFDAPREIESTGAAEVTPAGRLELRDVGFRFPGTEQWALRHLNLTVEPGQTVALVGATGAGKSVLTSLIPRLYDVSEGAVLIDGVDVRTLPLSTVRRVVATAFEDPTLFSMSVRENLTLGRPEATETEIRRAIEVAQAGFVDDLPFGLDTRIGEQGMSLSGGQRQRLSLARAVLSDPRILVLDDTLSALDVHTEALVEAALRNVLHDVTGIVVAHRASTVLLADRVALLEGGTITHVGSHAELLATVPSYRFLLAADDELDPSLAHEECWETDEEKQAIAHAHATVGIPEDEERR